MRKWLALSLGLIALTGCGESAEHVERSGIGGSASAEPGGIDPGGAELAVAGREIAGAPTAGLPGFLVWESNRSGRWRLWIRELEGSPARQLTPDEPKRRHCCAHVSPDGGWISYLSLPAGKQEYPKGGSRGPLRLIRPDGSEQIEVAPEARTYFEHRAVVWRSDDQLIYIDSRGRTLLATVPRGDGPEAGAGHEILVGEEQPEYGWLLDSRLRSATRGRAEFGTFDADSGRVALRTDAKGCQPYFSHDGRWGFWMAGVGGPINRIDLATFESSTILHKNDTRLLPGLGYLYFPMLSRDGLLLAFGASAGQHDHFRADYEILVAEVDPATLELLGEPVRMTEDPGTDRFPDVHVEPLPLGRHYFEAPHAISWEAPDKRDGWSWRVGDAEVGAGPTLRHVFERSGRFEVAAERGDEIVRGQVVVSEARPPVAERVAVVEEGRRLDIHFDEALGARPPEVELSSGIRPLGLSQSGDRRTWRLELEEPLRGGDRVSVRSAIDAAQRPNEMVPTELVVEPPLWPSDRRELAFVWATGAAPNLVWDPDLGGDRATAVRPRGRSVFDRHSTMVLGRGSFEASERDAAQVLTALRAANRLSLEAYVSPGATGRLIGMGGLHLNFALRAEGGHLHFTMRHGARGPRAFQGARLVPYEAGRSLHLVVTYTPGRLAAYVDGKPAGRWPISGDFFHWRSYPLSFGEGVTLEAAHPARLEGVAIYGRVLEPEEVRENFLRYRALRARRAPLEPVVVQARLARASRTPTLQEISPYTEALSVYEWTVEQVLEGSLQQDSVRVAHWTVLDGDALPSAEIGARRRLRLEPFAANTQLEGTYLEDGLGDRAGALFYDVGG